MISYQDDEKKGKFTLIAVQPHIEFSQRLLDELSNGNLKVFIDTARKMFIEYYQI